ncbi:hypothetical protein GXW83_23185 [Streptacidiphilus sp. PB12-B1b]|uniref:right-handed parallel beta-helix repeat-containing protein n=1 Tax=Streptacidiphilus sp. PB12-B1b TaxID=2705012 RepID=UPI0015F85D97|nr:right-handed parallel beta-helix repeat-containing protein [Streptacidiphilus sp. PB12-B1b]QMU78170.1 hypothetical protein GXW83_23185 [Streptacidiphilus sp. PB12-B1b]
MPRPRLQRTFAGLATTLALLIAGAGTAAASGPATYYVDCSGGSDTAAGTSPTTAWHSFTRVDATVLRPGDTVRFRGGVTCDGTLAPQGSGTAAQPITLDSYGTGRAQIDGQGATAAILLHNVQGYDLTGLDVTDTGPAPTAGQQRVGVYVLLTDYGTGTHYKLTGLNVHGVNGSDDRYPDPSGGIIFEAGGTAEPTGFAGIDVRNNTVTDVDRTGIGIVSGWQKRSVNPTGPGASFAPNTRVLIAGNQVTDVGGDGIMVFNGEHALVEHNVIDGYNERSTDYNVGAYAWNSDDSVFQYNDVSHGVYPAMAFDFEGADTGTVYQYNLSHDNGGGALFSCPSEGTTSSGGIFRYNISQNDVGPGYLGVITLLCGDEPGTQIYNNTFYDPTTPNMVESSGASTFRITDNIFVGQPGGSALADTANTYAYNAYQDITGSGSVDPHAVLANPLLVAPGTATSRTDAGGYRLGTGSAALGAGTPIAGNGGRDYFGNPIPATDPNLGAYQGGAVASRTH